MLQADNTADPVLARLQKLHPKLIDLGLERTEALAQAVGSPHQKLPPVIHVAGTNGKGSVTAFIRAFAEAAGLRVHVYNSPHLCEFRERIRLAGSLISTAELIALLERCEAANKGAPITFFEITTVAALLGFSEVTADLLILETGLGGLHDSTNIIADTACSIITPIARDHEHFLGTDLRDIATQKAGIMRPSRPTIWAQQTAEVAAVLTETGANMGADIFRSGDDFNWRVNPDKSWHFNWNETSYTLPAPSLRGSHQYDNAALALMGLLASDVLTATTVQSALSGAAQASWPGRIQNLTGGLLSRLNGGAPLWLDGAHNPHGADALCKTLDELSAEYDSAGTGWQIIYGALNTRPPEPFLNALSSHINTVFCVTIEGEDASIPAETLANNAQNIGFAARACSSLPDAIMHCDKTRPVLICGSLYLAGNALRENETFPD